MKLVRVLRTIILGANVFCIQGGPKVGSLGYPQNGLPSDHFFLAVSSKNTDLNNFHMKIFNIKFVTKKVILIFGLR